MQIDYLSLLLIILSSIAPGFEARYAAPLALSLGLRIEQALILTIPTSLIPVFLILAIGNKLLAILRKMSDMNYVNFVASPLYRVVLRAREKVSSKFELAGYVGLTLFVAIPLPFTGVWTASLGASLLGLNRVRSLLAIAIGNFIAVALTTGLFSILLSIMG
ncbi:MAG: small multi-drug export [Thermoprotei archaeon]|nr:MAG: small multi-drug export [Thermoprotei archaeon]